MSQTEKRDFSKPVKLIHNLLPKGQQKLMEFPLDSMIGYVEESGDTEGKGAEAKFRTFMLVYRHWLISEKKVPTDYFGNSFIQATTDELWDEAQRLYKKLKGEKTDGKGKS
ncbi:hypothetical protein [Enterococcus casseliflavus]|uniref:hypothetical protein n=1 Tax=Enterococcus casseliflavus TaxID=37734 RepID=UPI0012E2D90F|nr:hypothetical protein [Enterococcus casseliflavus]MUN75679.1 hypothetical protein [Enterococcus casseliflavus]MUN97976.1 hypothetical protein [Enterococcus casseliflavus]